MVAEADDLVADVGDVGVEIGWVGAVAGVGLEELVPEEDAVFVTEVVEVLAGALADPVADDVEMGVAIRMAVLDALSRGRIAGRRNAP